MSSRIRFVETWTHDHLYTMTGLFVSTVLTFDECLMSLCHTDPQPVVCTTNNCEPTSDSWFSILQWFSLQDGDEDENSFTISLRIELPETYPEVIPKVISFLYLVVFFCSPFPVSMRRTYPHGCLFLFLYKSSPSFLFGGSGRMKNSSPLFIHFIVICWRRKMVGSGSWQSFHVEDFVY